MRPIFRFAPSPTGYLHLGHARSALVGHDWARRIGGAFLLRIENTDVERCRPEFEAAILEDLARLGLTWDGPVLRQSEHFTTYAAAADHLRLLGLLYPCQATRAEIEDAAGQHAPRDPDGAVLVRRATHAAGNGREVPGRPVQMRLDMARAIAVACEMAGDAAFSFTAIEPDGRHQVMRTDPAAWGDVVVQRKGTPTSYHLSVVVDDARQGVSHVTRGLDLLRATDLHRLLQVLLGLPAPMYHHHGLVLGADGRKLAKTRNSQSLRDLLAAGWTAADVRHVISAGRGEPIHVPPGNGP